ncbi:UHRF1-binding protein 1 [Manis javanica]|nr:UHRF1-binding protein 1 [Manis javanica]
MDSGDEQVLSVSPELFDWDGERILTPPRGHGAGAPRLNRTRRMSRPCGPRPGAGRERMIDLLRNDVSRIAEPFSVQVPRLFHAKPPAHRFGR